MDPLSIFIGFIVGLITNHLSPGFSRLVNGTLSWTAALMSPNGINTTGIWQQDFLEPDPSDPTQKRSCSERIDLKQIGTIISGDGIIKTDGRTFKYSLTIDHNMVFGRYKKDGRKGNIAGHGMIQLIINAERDQMKGQATWFDADTQKIEYSEVIWTRR